MDLKKAIIFRPHIPIYKHIVKLINAIVETSPISIIVHIKLSKI